MATNTQRVVADFAQGLAVLSMLSAAFAPSAPSAALFSPILSALCEENGECAQ